MRFKINFFALMLILSLFLSASFYAFIPICAAVIHELGHIFAAKLRGVRLGKLEIGIFGARLFITDTVYSYIDEMIICFAGPLMNLISADILAIAIRLSGSQNSYFKLFIFSSLSLGIVNLMPIRSFDGGRIIASLISHIGNEYIAERVVKILSFISLFALWTLSLYLLLRTSASLSIFIFSVSLFANIFIDGT